MLLKPRPYKFLPNHQKNNIRHPKNIKRKGTAHLSIIKHAFSYRRKDKRKERKDFMSSREVGMCCVCVCCVWHGGCFLYGEGGRKNRNVRYDESGRYGLTSVLLMKERHYNGRGRYSRRNRQGGCHKNPVIHCAMLHQDNYHNYLLPPFPPTNRRISRSNFTFLAVRTLREPSRHLSSWYWI